jgi:phosphatidylethanolamine-binding protein (PEBP) family uncharacterized protein
MPPETHRPPTPARLRLATLVVMGIVVVVGSACATNFRTMRKPAPGATAPASPSTVITTTTVQPVIATASPTLFVLTSPGFEAGGTVPATYTCDGPGTSPALAWSNVPPHTVELVLAISDPQANSALQWMVADINPSTTGVAAGATPAGGVVLANRAGAHAYAPLCPAAGQDDTFEFTLYALSRPSGLTAGSDATAALAKVSTDATGTQAVLTGDYRRP